MFDVGQKVVCINGDFDDWSKSLYTAFPTKDKVYVIRDVRLGVTFEGGQRIGAASVLLVGLVNPCAISKMKLERGFNSDRFAPLEEVKEKSRNKQQADSFKNVEILVDLIYSKDD